jgi:hypothetical protein
MQKREEATWRSTGKWEDGIKIKLIEIEFGCLDLIYLAQNWVSCWELLNTVMNGLSFSIKVGKCMTN